MPFNGIFSAQEAKFPGKQRSDSALWRADGNECPKQRKSVARRVPPKITNTYSALLRALFCYIYQAFQQVRMLYFQKCAFGEILRTRYSKLIFK